MLTLMDALSPGIESTPAVCGGDPCVVRTRIPVRVLRRSALMSTELSPSSWNILRRLSPIFGTRKRSGSKRESSPPFLPDSYGAPPVIAAWKPLPRQPLTSTLIAAGEADPSGMLTLSWS